MKRGRRAKAARPAVPEILADRAEEAAGDAAKAADATASRTKITVSLRGSRASHAGSFPFPWIGWAAGTKALAALWFEERLITTTSQKRQKEMKRIENRQMKEEKSAHLNLHKPPP